MAKDKKKKKKQDIDIEALAKEYENGIEMNKAKGEQLNGTLREAELILQEIREIKDGLKRLRETLDNR